MAEIKALLVTANTGSIFEDPTRLLQVWVNEFCKHIRHHRPDFVALHLQEVGGKTYEKSLEYVQEFIKLLCEAKEFIDFNRIQVYLDEDYKSAEHFTALGNLYFASKNIKDLNIWNFLTHEWETVTGKSILTGNIESVATKEKAKFPQNFFPECKWSRKGFMRTRWSLNGSVFDLVNIHLFHDASNLAACQEYPSVYCKSRRRALLHTLERFHTDKVNEPVPYFIFGDFNFRCDTAGVIKELTENLTMHRIQNVKSDNTKVQYRDNDGANVLTVGKKEFNHADHQTKFKEDWLRKFDLELDPLREILYEYPITFPPSYPYEEDTEQPYHYMSTRCPSWCDRVLLSPAAKKLIEYVDDEENEDPKNIYNIIGKDICMGDHKPVYLSIRMKIDQGIVSCYGEHASAQNNEFLHQPNNNRVVSPCAACLHNFEQALERIYHFDESEGVKGEIKRGNEVDQEVNVVDGVCVGEGDGSGGLIPRPKISINVIDTENLSVCMCSLYNSRNNSEDNLLRSTTTTTTVEVEDPNNDESNPICPICRNIIKKQPSERITLTSKRLLLSNDIIVNRIDSHYLNTFSGINLKQQDPYTPESPDSFSPMIESDSSGSNREDIHHEGEEEELIQSNNANNESNNLNLTNPFGLTSHRSSGGVSPRQLKSRLEILKRLADVSVEMNENLHDEGGPTVTILSTNETCTENHSKQKLLKAIGKKSEQEEEESEKSQKCCSKSCSIL